MSPQAFRERHRHYGVWVPVSDVPAHFANGWAPADPEDLLLPDEAFILRPPHPGRFAADPLPQGERVSSRLAGSAK